MLNEPEEATAMSSAEQGEGVKMKVADVKHIVFGECGLDAEHRRLYRGT